MKRALPILLVLALPRAAAACAVCGAAVDRNNTAFVITTILLSLLPLALIGAGLWWIARHTGGALAGEFTEREVGVGTAGVPVTREGGGTP